MDTQQGQMDNSGDRAETAQMGFNRYGKTNVQMLRVVKDSPRHEIFALTGQVLLEGRSFDEHFLRGDNSTLVPTETQKNTLYVLSKLYPIDPLERWVVFVAQDFMHRHKQIEGVFLHFDKTPWDRIKVGGQEHNHAFVEGNTGTRFVTLHTTRAGKIDLVAGFKDLKVMKTTQSGFEGFTVDEYTTLKPTNDRVMCTKIYCEWTFCDVNLDAIDFNAIYDAIQRITLDTLAGPPDVGVYSASVQHTIYQIAEAVLKRYDVIDKITFKLPNIHYYLVDFNAFKTTLQNKNEVYFTFNGAAGQIEGTIQRKKKAKL